MKYEELTTPEAGLDRYVVARRLPELAQQGCVLHIQTKRLDRITNRWATTWKWIEKMAIEGEQ